MERRGFYKLAVYISVGFMALVFFCGRSVDVAAATDVEDAVYMIQSAQNTDFVVDLQYRTRKEGNNIALYKKIGSVTQLFAIQYVKSVGDTKYYRIMNPYSLNVLDVENASGADGANCIQYHWTKGADNQLWCFEDAGGGCFRIRSMLGTYLDNADWNVENDNNIQLWTGTDGDNQKWKLQRMGSIKLASMLYNEFHEMFEHVAEDGNNNVKYNEWFYGTDDEARAKYGPWCAVFQSWCAYKSNLDDYPRFFGATASGIAKKYYWLTMSGYQEAEDVYGNRYQPKVGDLIFINNKEDGSIDSICHVGFVCNIYEDGTVWTIDGNAATTDDPVFKVRLTERNINDGHILGYASIKY